ncbi:hypothetical protein [Streptomyces alanosinicus]|uniref:Uncharacterized protein n=1 Tax=Streptomyces alanosinicus TaxID=68171 RepID=A0A918YHP1_9ACTN|nr:hypothetical protein [Streptomyces alanosinicus]GHE03254.1 hypothetical protein GCM10010339_29940 [Streptomyces alanosinicus]
MTTTASDRLHGIEVSRAEQIPLVTGCGRRIEVRHLRLGPPDRPVRRIALNVGEDQGGEPGVWAALTPAEARGLARLLLQQAGQAGATEQSADAGPRDAAH